MTRWPVSTRHKINRLVIGVAVTGYCAQFWMANMGTASLLVSGLALHLLGIGLIVDAAMCMGDKRFVYITRSDVDPDRHYVGITSDVEGRLRWHNSGPSGVTLRGRPWSLVVTLEFPTEAQARGFERYLKLGSGRAFAKRHVGG